MVMHAIIRLQQFFDDVEVEARLYQASRPGDMRLLGLQRMTLALPTDSEDLDELEVTLRVLVAWVAKQRAAASRESTRKQDHGTNVEGGGRA
jgi:hypothetical protein